MRHRARADAGLTICVQTGTDETAGTGIDSLSTCASKNSRSNGISRSSSGSASVEELYEFIRHFYEGCRSCNKY